MLLLLPELCKHRGRESGRETEEEEEGEKEEDTHILKVDVGV